ncbi:hypothetical protein NBRC116589_28510 [Ruegeria sp. HU-ET01832]|uniref:hypothetical protein n=1 Tax=Ruegeria sp. HU-ET01832 TaxID=3135906 RepID=UPI00310A8899
MKRSANKLLATSAIAIALLASGAALTASTQSASAEAGYFWDETVESLDRSPWIFEGTSVFGELARVPPSDWVRTLEKAAYPTELETFVFTASNNEEQNINDWLSYRERYSPQTNAMNRPTFQQRTAQVMFPSFA